MVRTGIKLELDVGDVLSSAGRAKSAIASLTSEMSKAAKAEDWDKYAKLQFDRDRLQSKNTGFEKDIHSLYNNPKFQGVGANGQPVFKMDPEYGSLMKAQIDAIKKLTAEYNQALQAGDATRTWELSGQIETKQDEFHKLVEQANGNVSGGNSTQNLLKAMGLERITSALTSGLNTWAQSLDRSGIISQYGSGDIMGAQLSERRRESSFWGGLLKGGLTIGGGVAGFLLGGPAGMIAGSTGGGALGDVVQSGFDAKNNIEATKVAAANLWENKTADAMNLAAITGDPKMIRESFKMAADTAAEFGYSAEEGMAAIKQAAEQGLSGSGANSLVGEVFDYERRTGADRGTLMGLSAMSARYGGGDALRDGWAGLNASGMQTGQYNEYLRGIQRVMEDGISKGFIRSSDQVVASLTMLAAMTGNDPLWQGENGARRLMEMNEGFESATGLQSATDILAYRAAKSLPGMADKDYVDVMEVLEGGMTGGNGVDLLKNFMTNIDIAEGGSRNGKTERLRQLTGWNYTTTNAFMRGYGDGSGIDTEKLEILLEEALKNEALPNADSPELDAAKVTQSITNWWTQTGQTYWDGKLPTLGQELAKAIENYNKETGSNVEVPNVSGITLAPAPDTSSMAPEVAADAWTNEVRNLQENGYTDTERYRNAVEEEYNASFAASEHGLERMHLMSQADNQLKKMYDEFFGSREEKATYRGVNSILGEAMSSTDMEERNAAMDFARALSSMTESERGAINRYNENDTWNQLGAATDIHSLIAALKQLTDRMDDINFTFEEN